MSEDNGKDLQGPELVQKGEDKAITVTCQKCKAAFTYTPPEPLIINQEQFAQAIWVHEENAKCNACGQVYVFSVAGLSTNWGLAPLLRSAAKEKSRILVPPAGMRIPRP